MPDAASDPPESGRAVPRDRGVALPAVAGASLADPVAGPHRSARILAAFPNAVYLAPDGGRVIAVEAADGVGLPNALRLAIPSHGLALAEVDTDAGATVGGGHVRLPGLDVAVDRWQDHRLHPGGIDTGLLVRKLEELDDFLTGQEPLDEPLAGRVADLEMAVATGEPEAMIVAGRAIVGLGGGLTPSGDDVICGLLSTGRTLTSALGLQGRDDALHRLGGALVADAAERTTALSAALLWHAARGELARPARALLRALLGRTPLEPAARALVTVGHSSGRDLTIGIAMGVRAALAAEPTTTSPATTPTSTDVSSTAPTTSPTTGAHR